MINSSLFLYSITHHTVHENHLLSTARAEHFSQSRITHSNKRYPDETPRPSGTITLLIWSPAHFYWTYIDGRAGLNPGLYPKQQIRPVQCEPRRAELCGPLRSWYLPDLRTAEPANRIPLLETKDFAKYWHISSHKSIA